jgi:preprotein translocase subunit SecA
LLSFVKRPGKFRLDCCVADCFFIHMSVCLQIDLLVFVVNNRRVLELRHYDVQLMGGLILHDGALAEMATGEGKTLVSTLPTYLNALTGKTSFVITVNDYLAKRDMEKMGQVHRFLGLNVGLVQSSMTEAERRVAYRNDVVYVTNSELGFDYLRDHLALTPEQTVLPNSGGEFDGFCVVDEADSVLIDEARTPLIISKQVPAPANKYKTAFTLAEALKPNVHYTVDLKNKACTLTEVGYRDSERALGIDSLFSVGADGEAWAPFITNAINAKELFNKDIEYALLTDSDGQKTGVGIIDSFTGRILDGRRWSDGLHQSIETKEGISVSEQSKVIAKVTYQVSLVSCFEGNTSYLSLFFRLLSPLRFGLIRLYFVNFLVFRE